MIKISDFINEDDLSRLASHTVRVGDVYEITMTEANGIKPKKGDSSRDKYFVVLGFDANGIVYGGVVINSMINKNLPAHLKMYHIPLKQAKYQFLRYDSFVDCLRLKIALPQKFNEWNFLGEIDEYDVELIKGTIKESPAESKERLAQFGL
ncbi:MAG: hypothetical protein K2M53_05895 [Muribaculaceae bacterium]|nr:hypothetical protein [Muribaculaceae bacterium]